MRGKKILHWIADAAAATGGVVLGLVAKGALALGGGPLAAVAIATALALKVSRSPVRSKPEGTATGGGV